jgi:hypothetical protein
MFEQSLKVGRGSSSCCLVGKYHGLVVDTNVDWKPMECAEEWCDMGEIGKVEHEAGCRVLDQLQGFDGTAGGLSKQRVAAVQEGNDTCLD